MRRIKLLRERIFVYGFAVLLTILLASSKSNIYGQGMTNVNVTGIPGMINNPYTDEFFDNFLNGRYQVVFTYHNNNTQPVDFVFQFVVFKDNKQVIEVESLPQSYVPGAYVFSSLFSEIPFSESPEDVLNQISSDLRNQIMQGGVLPEGSYRLEIRAVSEPNNPAINAVPSITNFMVIYPDAPILINPTDRAELSLPVPVFSWTPVPIAGQLIEYEFLLVEVFEGQTPLQAMQSNRAHAEQRLLGTNTLLYTPEYLPLEEGKEYAWQVKAVSITGDLPVKNNGESVIRTFTYNPAGISVDLDKIEELVVIPGLAVLKNLGDLDKTTRGGILALNGEATLELFGQTGQQISVWLNNLELQAINPSSPVILGGGFEALESLQNLPFFRDFSHLAQLDELRWQHSTGNLEVSGDIVLPDGDLIPSDTWLQLLPGGLFGKLIADNPSGVLVLGDDPFELYIDKFEASFPELQIFATGRAELFNGEASCEVTQLNVLESESQAIINCPVDATVPLVEGSEQLELALQDVGGTVNYNFGSNDLSYNVTANGEISLGLEDITSCSILLQTNLSSENGFKITQVTPTCGIFAAPLDLGFMKLKLNDIAVNQIAYLGKGEWDFDAILDASLQIPAMGGWTLPLADIGLTPAGLKFPDLNWDEFELGLTNPLAISGFGIKPLQFSMSEFTFPLFSWKQNDIEMENIGDWNFDMLFDFTLPGNFSAGATDFSLPPCLVSGEIKNLSGTFRKGAFEATIPSTLLSDCELELADGYTFKINELGGELTASASVSDLNLESLLHLDAELSAGYPFSCAEGVTANVAQTQLQLDNDGYLTGLISDIVDGCAIELGPITAQITRSDLVFDKAGNTQKISIAADGELLLGGNQTASGNLVYNIIEGDFEELNFELDELYLLNLPGGTSPALTFLVNGINLTADGLLLDGRHEFLMGDIELINNTFESQFNPGATIIDWPEGILTLGATFQDLVVDLSGEGIKSGRIIFDENFGLLAEISEFTNDIQFTATRNSDSGIPDISGNSLYMELAGQVILDENGLHANGNAAAALKLGNFDLDELVVDFKDDFTMSLNPFSVQSGEADILYEYRRLAYINGTGFHLDPSYLTQAIPDTLGLPSIETAYIVLRDEFGELLIDAVQNSNGTYTFNSLNPLELVFPVLQHSGAGIPSVSVNFDDVIFDPGLQDITAGRIEGDFSPAFDLEPLGLPFKLRRVIYDDGFALDAPSFAAERGLFFESDLILFDEQLGEAGNALLYLQNGERFRAEIEIPDLNTTVPLVEGSNLAALEIDALFGEVDVRLDGFTLPDINFEMDGRFAFKNHDDELMASLDFEAEYLNDDFVFTAAGYSDEESIQFPYFAGPLGFGIDRINSLSLSYSTANRDFDFHSDLGLSFLFSLEAGDTLNVPVANAEITQNGIIIPQQTINESSLPALRSAPISFGPAQLDMLSFTILDDVVFNWFTGESVPPAFLMDFDLRLDALSANAPLVSQAPITLKNVGYNKGVLTGEIEDYDFYWQEAPIVFGGDTRFYVSKISGGLINDGTIENPIQGYDLALTGSLFNEGLFTSDGACINPELTLNLSKEGGVTGVAESIVPCGELKYDPITLSFDQESRLEFAFTGDEQQIILEGGALAVIEQSGDNPDITATGEIVLDVINGALVDGEIVVNDLFTYGYPAQDPLFKFRIPEARLNMDGLVINSEADLIIPGTSQTVTAQFTNFTMELKTMEMMDGEFTVEDSVAVELGITPIDWTMVNPETDFTRDNAARLYLAGGFKVDKNGLELNGQGNAAIQAAGGQFSGAMDVDYSGLGIQFNPTRVDVGRADFTMTGQTVSFGYLDKDGFTLDIPALIVSVAPDTLPLPTMNIAYLVLGDDDGSRYEMVDKDEQTRIIRTIDNKTVELVIPEVKNSAGAPLKVPVEFTAEVDQYMAVQDGFVQLAASLDLTEYVGVPLTLDSLSYSSYEQKLLAMARVILPNTLEEAELAAVLEIDENGFRAELSGGEYAETYTEAQEDVNPLAEASLGNGDFEFYIRGFNLEIGQTNSLKFSGQVKSELLVNESGAKTPIHYAAQYEAGSSDWQVLIDSGNLGQGMRLGVANIAPRTSGGASLFNILMNNEEFAIAFAGIITMPEMLGDEFALDIEEFRVSSKPVNGEYISINASALIPDQNFKLIDGILDFTSTNTQIAYAEKFISLSTSGSFNFYNKTDLEFNDLVFKSDGTMSYGSVGVTNLLTDPVALLPDDILTLEELGLVVENDILMLTATGTSQLPSPLSASTGISIKAGTDGSFELNGPEFIFDDGFGIGNNPDTEFALGNFATLELSGLGLDINLKDYKRTTLYAAGAIYISNDTGKRITFGDLADLKTTPGIKYSIEGGVEWNISANFDAGELAFDYEFFSIDVNTIGVAKDVEIGGVNVPFQISIGGAAGLNIDGVGGSATFEGFKFSTLGVDEIGSFVSANFTLMDIVSLELGSFDYKVAESGESFTLKFADNSGSNVEEVKADSIEINNVEKYLHFAGVDGGQALKLSLTNAFSGSIEEVLYYQTGDGERYMRIKKVDIALSDMASVFLDMEFINSEDNGFSLSVAGAGTFSGYGVAAAGTISTFENDLRFGIFVAASLPINFLGIIELNRMGGGFFYRPTGDNINMVIDAVKGLDPTFVLNGEQPTADSLNFAIFAFAGMSVGGQGNNAAISGNALLQVTDQYTKIDANVTVFNQGDSFRGGMYLTARYTADLYGIEGGFNFIIDYKPVISGNSEVDFFALKETGSDLLWGITGFFNVDVLPDLNMLSLKGELIVSSDGLFLDLEAAGGFNIAIISGDASFNMLVWYLPNHTDPFGIYGKFKVGFSVLGGLAKFGASVEGGFFVRSQYSMIYFAGSAYIEVLFVFEGSMSGYVKFTTQPKFDYGTGGDPELEQMIADAKATAQKTKEKAEETKNALNDAQESLNNALIDAVLEGFSDEELEQAGFNLVSGKYGAASKVLNIERAENNLLGGNTVPTSVKWIAENVMRGARSYSFGGSYSFFRGRPEIRDTEITYVTDVDDLPLLRSTQENALAMLEANAPAVESRLNQAIAEFTEISDRMRTDLDSGELFSLQNPVSGITPGVFVDSIMVVAPGFNVDEDIVAENAAKLEAIENEIQLADQRYREAIEAAVDNVRLIDQVIENKDLIDWGSPTSTQNTTADEQISVNELARVYMQAVQSVRRYNSLLIGSYWDLREWAQYRSNKMDEYRQEILGAQNNNFDYVVQQGKLNQLANLALMRENLIIDLGGSRRTTNIEEFLLGVIPNTTEQHKRDGLRKNAEDFWYKMPKLGLQKLANQSRTIADSLVTVVEDNFNNIQSKHSEFTQSVDQIYTVKSEMLVTIHGMIEEYNAWRTEAMDTFGEEEEATAPYSDKLNLIQNALAPPVIQFVSGKAGQGEVTGSYSSTMSEYRDFYGIARLSYQASHPIGVPEMSFSLLDGTVSSIYAVQDYYTAGVWESGDQAQRYFEMYVPKISQSENIRSLTGAVRARSAGGTTSSRLVNFSVPVGLVDSYNKDAVVVHAGDDTTPPTTPVVTHNYLTNKNYYWLSDSTRVNFTITSADNESGISLFKYRIGTSPGGGEIQDWSDAQGSRSTGENTYYMMMWGGGSVPITTNYSKMEASLRGLGLQAETNYYFTFKTVNGDGLESTEQRISKPFRYDATVPKNLTVDVELPNVVTEKELAKIIKGATSSPKGSFSTLPPATRKNAVAHIPEWNANRVNNDNSQISLQPVVLDIAAEDVESGVLGFAIGHTSVEDAPANLVFKDDDADFIKTSSPYQYEVNAPFEKPLYLHVKARNYAQGESETQIVGPFQSIDTTPPTTPNIEIMGGATGFSIYVTSLSDDRQSGVKGYQYMLISSSGDTLKHWSESDEADIIMPSITGRMSSVMSRRPLSKTFNASRGKYSVVVRAINNQNLVSRSTIVENVWVDPTPPSATKGIVTFMAPQSLELGFTQIGKDNQSGVESIRYTVVPGKGTAFTSGSAMGAYVSGLGENSNIQYMADLVYQKHGVQAVLVTGNFVNNSTSQEPEYDSPIEDIINNPSTSTPLVIDLDPVWKEFVQLHAFLFADGANNAWLNPLSMENAKSTLHYLATHGYLPKIIITTRNNVGLITDTELNIEIPDENLESYIWLLWRYFQDYDPLPTPDLFDSNPNVDTVMDFVDILSGNNVNAMMSGRFNMPVSDLTGSAGVDINDFGGVDLGGDISLGVEQVSGIGITESGGLLLETTTGGVLEFTGTTGTFTTSPAITGTKPAVTTGTDILDVKGGKSRGRLPGF